LLTSEESLGLIPKLRHVRLEYHEQRADYEILQLHPISTCIRQAQMIGSILRLRSLR
jgi:hypothetical protein